MKTLTTLLILLSSTFLYAQITLESNNFPEAGEHFPISNGNGSSIDYTSTGPDFVWDFSGLEETSQSFENTFSVSSAGVFAEAYFGAFAPQAYKATYYQPYDGLPLDQISNFLPISIESINLFTKVETDKITSVGYSLSIQGNHIGFRSDTIEVAYKLPLTYGDSNVTVGYTNFDFQQFYDGQFIQHRVVTTIVDGYGELTTPYDFYPDVIRVRKNIAEQDSLRIVIDVMGFPIDQWVPINRTISHYEWWDNVNHRPVVRVETERIAGNETVSRLTYFNNNVWGIDKNNLETLVYPNPSSNIVHIQAKEVIQSYHLFDVTGKEVLSERVDNQTLQIDISTLPNGIYTLKCSSNNNQSISKIIKK